MVFSVGCTVLESLTHPWVVLVLEIQIDSMERI